MLWHTHPTASGLLLVVLTRQSSSGPARRKASSSTLIMTPYSASLTIRCHSSWPVAQPRTLGFGPQSRSQLQSTRCGHWLRQLLHTQAQQLCCQDAIRMQCTVLVGACPIFVSKFLPTGRCLVARVGCWCCCCACRLAARWCAWPGQLMACCWRWASMTAVSACGTRRERRSTSSQPAAALCGAFFGALGWVQAWSCYCRLF